MQRLLSGSAPSGAIAVDLTYSLLNEDEEEIRLMNILPYASRSSLLRCTLETVSLKSLTTEYRNFMSMSRSTGRKLVVHWNRLQTSAASLDKHDSINSSHRFTWGDYAALSYVWGDLSETSPIILNGQEIRVQQNLEGALRNLSSRADFHGRYKLWVDAICINQQDWQEKSRQIRRMKNIYGDAHEVIAWLGEGENESDKAINLVQALSEASFNDCGEELEIRLREDPDYLGFGCWMALHDLMGRQYWYRLWIIQEVILGSSSVVLRCGNRSIDWTSFCRGIGFLFDYLWTVKDSLLGREIYMQKGQNPSAWITTSLHLVHRNLWALSRQEEYGGDDYMSFGQLLDLANSAASRDSRDKVYGLVGMMDPVIAENVVPDYTLPPSKVYAAVAKTFICTHGNLEPLREGNPWGGTRSPSWAADWTWNGRIRHARLTASVGGPFWRPKGVPPNDRLAMPYRASGDHAMEVNFSNHDSHLTCRGFVIDEVDGLAAREHGYFSWASHTIRQPKSDSNAYKNMVGVVDTLFRALISDRVAGGLKASERHVAILSLPSKFDIGERQFKKLGWTWLSNQQNYYFRWSEWRLANRSFRIFGTPLDEYFSDTIPEGASEYDYTEAYCCNNRTGHGRRFMTTMNGYLGWAPDNLYDDDDNQVKSGDKIAIIFGCSTPIVIRPLGGYFQVLGEAYIQGLMDGEALALLELGKRQAQYFTFC